MRTVFAAAIVAAAAGSVAAQGGPPPPPPPPPNGPGGGPPPPPPNMPGGGPPPPPPGQQPYVPPPPPDAYTTVTMWDDCTPDEPMETITLGVTVTECHQCEEATHTTVYVKEYDYICPTGIAQTKYTITETCTGETPYWPMTTAQNYIPPGFEQTVTVCNHCAPTPTTVTLTVPCNGGCSKPTPPPQPYPNQPGCPGGPHCGPMPPPVPGCPGGPHCEPEPEPGCPGAPHCEPAPPPAPGCPGAPHCQPEPQPGCPGGPHCEPAPQPPYDSGCPGGPHCAAPAPQPPYDSGCPGAPHCDSYPQPSGMIPTYPSDNSTMCSGGYGSGCQNPQPSSSPIYNAGSISKASGWSALVGAVVGGLAFVL